LTTNDTNWGPFLLRWYELVFIVVPAGLAGAAAIWLAGKLWLNRRES
jgi:hypothetical protein